MFFVYVVWLFSAKVSIIAIHNPLLDYVSTKTSAEFKGSCLKQDKFQFDSEEVKSCLWEK